MFSGFRYSTAPKSASSPLKLDPWEAWRELTWCPTGRNLRGSWFFITTWHSSNDGGVKVAFAHFYPHNCLGPAGVLVEVGAVLASAVWWQLCCPWMGGQVPSSPPLKAGQERQHLREVFVQRTPPSSPTIHRVWMQPSIWSFLPVPVASQSHGIHGIDEADLRWFACLQALLPAKRNSGPKDTFAFQDCLL